MSCISSRTMISSSFNHDVTILQFYTQDGPVVVVVVATYATVEHESSWQAANFCVRRGKKSDGFT